MVAHWRGQGAGRELLRAVAGQARAARVGRISLSVERKNFARQLYLSEGYRVAAPGYAGSDTLVKDLRVPGWGLRQ